MGLIFNPLPLNCCIVNLDRSLSVMITIGIVVLCRFESVVKSKNEEGMMSWKLIDSEI